MYQERLQNAGQQKDGVVMPSGRPPPPPRMMPPGMNIQQGAAMQGQMRPGE